MLRRCWALLRRNLGYLAFTAVCGTAGAWGVTLASRIVDAWSYLEADHLGFRGRLHRADAELGFTGIPGARGQYLFPVGRPLAVHYSSDGFLVPASDAGGPPVMRPFVLALGCSFTFGAGTVAGDTYAWRVAQGLGGTALNSGKCAYGLAQMLLLAREQIPRYRPEVVLVQASPWLAGRGTSGNSRTTFGAIPVPYLTLSAQGELGIEPPAFRSHLFDLPVDDYDGRRGGVGRFIGFVAQVGLPLFVRDDLARVRTSVARWFDPEREQARRRAAGHPDEVARGVYRQIATLCAAAGSRMVLVRLSHPLQRHYDQFKDLRDIALWVDAQAALDALVDDGEEASYYQRFGQWRGSPPVLVDTHPNAEAHAIVAVRVLHALRAEQGARGRAQRADVPGPPADLPVHQ